jgi:uncharacterized repeat protein (TIGR01451 family)
VKTNQIINSRIIKSGAKYINRGRTLLSLLFVFVFLAPVSLEQGTAAKNSGQNSDTGPGPDGPKNERQHVYVHYDYMVAADGTSDAPDPDAIELVREAFDAHGIDLVIDSHHSAIPLWPMVAFGVDIGTCVSPEQTIAFDTLKAQYFHPTSAHEWHYAIFGERINCFGNTGIAWISGDDFVVSLGQFRDRLSRLPRDLILRWVAGTFMHELGHNLGLDHGGDSSMNYKPNYLSVMNYSFLNTGIPYAGTVGSTVPVGYRIDYSSQALPVLDENHLDETLGIQAGTTDITTFDGEFGSGVGSATGAIDWNLSGETTGRDVRVNLNVPDGDAYTPLTGFDDWSFVRDVLSGRTPKAPRRMADENRAHEPVVDSVEPASGTSLGGTAVTIRGMHLGKVDRVLFGGVEAPGFRIVDVQTIIATSPPGSRTARVNVGSGPNLSPGSSADLFTYLRPVINDISPHTGPVGTVITIHGERLATTSRVSFRDGSGNLNVDAYSFSVVDDNTIIAETPHCLGSGCSFDLASNVIVTTDAYGENEIIEHCCSELFFADFFIFATHPRPIPAVTSITPSSTWAATGLATIQIKGTGFRYLDENGNDQPNVNWITFGGVPATNLALWDSETITCNAPAGIYGTVDVHVWNFVGKSPVTATDRFTYAPANGLFLNQFALQHTVTPALATPWFPAGNYITYVLTITNPMQTDSTSVVLTDALPAEATLVACIADGGGVCSGSGNNRSVTFLSIPYGVPATVRLLVRLNDNVAPGTIIPNTAIVSSLTPDIDLSDNTTTTTVIVPAPPQPFIVSISPMYGPGSGGTTVLIQGVQLFSATAVRFGASNALSFTVVDDNNITALSPPGTGTIDITVSNPYVTSTLKAVDKFTYLPTPPTVTSVSPTSGPAAGGTTITIRGTGFLSATSVSVGPYGVASYTIVDDATITAVTNPAGALGPGTFDVDVSTAGGTSAHVGSDKFTYF